MVDITVYGNTVPRRLSADYQPLSPRAMRDGSLVTQDFWDMLALEGRVFTANLGSVATSIGYKGYAINRPAFWIRVPSGTTIVPLYAAIADDATGVNTVTLAELRYCQNDIGNGTSSAASAGPVSSRTDTPIASLCTARQIATGDTTAETNPISHYRTTWIRADDAGSDGINFQWGLKRGDAPLFLVGPATWQLFHTSTGAGSPTGYAVMRWAEFPSNHIQ